MFILIFFLLRVFYISLRASTFDESDRKKEEKVAICISFRAQTNVLCKKKEHKEGKKLRWTTNNMKDKKPKLPEKKSSRLTEKSRTVMQYVSVHIDTSSSAAYFHCMSIGFAFDAKFMLRFCCSRHNREWKFMRSTKRLT